MSDESQVSPWRERFIGGLVMLIVSTVVGIILYHYQQKSPELVFQTYSPARFKKGATHISIYNAKAENRGSKEATDVKAFFELPPTCVIQDLKVEPLPKSIDYRILKPTGPNTRSVEFPLLNPGDQISFYFHVEKGSPPDMKMEVRGKGTTGRRGAIGASPESRMPIWQAWLTGLLVATALLGAAMVFNWKMLLRDLREAMASREAMELRKRSERLATPGEATTEDPTHPRVGGPQAVQTGGKAESAQKAKTQPKRPAKTKTRERAKKSTRSRRKSG